MIKGSFIIFAARHAEFSGHAAFEGCIFFFQGKKNNDNDRRGIYCALKRQDETTGPPSKFNWRENGQLAARDLLLKKVADTVIPGNVDYPGKAEYKLAREKTNILHIDNNSSVNSLRSRKSRIGELARGEVNIFPTQIKKNIS